jgi:hypothetical protein
LSANIALSREAGERLSLFLEGNYSFGGFLSVAEKAGIKQKDVVVEFNGKKIGEYHDLPAIVAMTHVGSDAEVKLMREGKPVTLHVKIAELPEGATSEAGDVEEEKGEAFGLSLRDLTPEVAQQFNLKEGEGVIGLVQGVGVHGLEIDAGLLKGRDICGLEVEAEAGEGLVHGLGELEVLPGALVGLEGAVETDGDQGQAETGDGEGDHQFEQREAGRGVGSAPPATAVCVRR